MKIIHGLEEVDIVPWYECEDCTRHAPFSGRLSALLFLHRFANSRGVMGGLRNFLRGEGGSAIRHFHSDEKVLDRIAQMIASGELHLTRRPLDFRLAPPRLSTGTAPPRPPSQPELAASPRQSAEPQPAPPPEEPGLPPQVDMAAIARVLRHAAISGKPFCAQ